MDANVIDRLPALVWQVNQKGGGCHFNSRWLDFTGLSWTESSGDSWQAAIHPNDLAGVLLLNTPARVFSGAKTEARIKGRHGNYAWYLIKAEPIESVDAEQNFVLLAVESRSTNEDSDEYGRPRIGTLGLWDQIPIWSTRADGYLDYANDLWLKCAGLSFQQAMGWGWADGVHPDDREGMTEIWRMLVEKQIEGYAEARMGSDDIGWRWYLSRAFPSRDDNGTIVRWYGALFDISDRKRAENALRVSEAYLANAQRVSQTGSFGLNFSNGALYWSDETYRIFEQARSEHPSLEKAMARVHRDDIGLVQRALDHSAVHDDEIDFSCRLVTRNGGIKFVRVLAKPVKGRGETRELVGAVIDITAARVAEDKLMQTHLELAHVSRVTAMGEMSASIVHEVNQPLSAIVTHGGACLRWLNRSEPNLLEATTSIEHMMAEAKRAGEVVRRLHAFAKKESSARALVKINDVIMETLPLVNLQRQTKRIDQRLDLGDNLPEILADRVQLQQVLMNLVGNAVQAVAQNTGIESGSIHIQSSRSAEGELAVTVRDTGPGLIGDTLNRIFEPFYTTKKEGMGMGLSICRSIVESHGGRITAGNNADKGAYVRVVLPVNP